MAVFPAQFFLLLGIDFFLAGSIAAIVFEERFPKAIPYMLILGSFLGFSQLLAGPEYMDQMDDAIQFYYCASFTLVAVASLVGLSLYLFFGQPDPTKKSVMVQSVLFTVALPIPAAVGFLFFASAYVNDKAVALPFLPAIPVSFVYAVVLGARAHVCVVLGLAYMDKVKALRTRLRRRSTRQKRPGNPSRTKDREQEEVEMGECPVCGTPSPLTAPKCPECGAEFDEGVDEEA